MIKFITSHPNRSELCEDAAALGVKITRPVLSKKTDETLSYYYPGIYGLKFIRYVSSVGNIPGTVHVFDAARGGELTNQLYKY